MLMPSARATAAVVANKAFLIVVSRWLAPLVLMGIERNGKAVVPRFWNGSGWAVIPRARNPALQRERGPRGPASRRDGGAHRAATQSQPGPHEDCSDRTTEDGRQRTDVKDREGKFVC